MASLFEWLFLLSFFFYQKNLSLVTQLLPPSKSELPPLLGKQSKKKTVVVANVTCRKKH